MPDADCGRHRRHQGHAEQQQPRHRRRPQHDPPGIAVRQPAIDQVRETARTKDAQDPDAAKRKLYDAFGALGVTAAQLDEYLGHTNALSPAELEDLRGYYSGIREGFTTWSAVIAAKEETKDGDGSAAAVDTLLAELEMTPAQARKAK